MKKICIIIILLIGICSLFEFFYNNEVTTKYAAAMPLLESINDIESYTFDDNYIKYIADNTTVSEFIENGSFSTSNVKVLDKENKELSNDEIITTSSKVIVETNDETKIYTVVVAGDVDQNGKADIKDILSVNKYRLGKIELKNEQFLAGDVDYNGEVNIKDLLRINKYRLAQIDSLLPERIEIEQITLNTYNIQIEEGSNYKLEASIMPENATDKELEYISSDEEIAIVSEKGLITGLKEGNCTIVVQARNGVSAECEVKVTKPSALAIPVERIETSHTDLNLDIEDTQKIEVTIKPSNASNKTLIWSSSNTNVATVDEEGRITAISEGETEITVQTTDGSNIAATVRINVKEKTLEENIILNNTEIILDLSETKEKRLVATVTPKDALEKTVIWSSSDERIVTVDGTGLVTGKTNGEATITAKTANGKTATCKVTVETSPTGITLNRTETLLDLNGTKTEQLTATVIPSTANVKNTITWRSGNTKIAKVSSTGEVTSVANGVATVTATTANGKTASCKVTVSQPSVQYQAHVQGNGWMQAVTDGKTAGTTGESRRIEAIKIKINNFDNLNVSYRAYMQGSGWEKDWKKDGEIAGIVGESKRLEAIQIKLSGENASKYDIYYRTHIQGFGWLGWVKNGDTAGSMGFGYRMEAIQIKVVTKGTEINSDIKGVIADSPNSINVLFIGNSKTYVSDINIRFQKLALAAGKEVHADRIPSYGGKTLYELSTYETVKTQIKSRKWDYIVLQEQTDTSEGNLSLIKTGCNNLINYTKNNSNKNVIPIYNATWIVKSANQTRQNTVNNNFNEVKKLYGGRICYSGNAFLKCSSQYPNLSLYTDDRHPTLAGQYLNACCIYATIFKETPVGIKATDVGDNDTKNLQQIAAKVMGL